MRCAPNFDLYSCNTKCPFSSEPLLPISNDKVTVKVNLALFYLREMQEMKGMVYRSCVRVAMLYGSETWCLREMR